MFGFWFLKYYEFIAKFILDMKHLNANTKKSGYGKSFPYKSSNERK